MVFKSKMRILLFVLCVVVIYLGVIANENLMQSILFKKDDQCETQDQTNGTCIPLQHCEALRNKIRGSDADREFLRRSHCGFESLTPLVCCPIHQNDYSNFPAPGICGMHTEDTSAPFDGETASILSYPWIALIQYSKPGELNDASFFCGGSLINKNHVLTAAHCFKGVSVLQSGWNAISVRLGEIDLRTALDCEDEQCADYSIDIPFLEVFVHEDYDSTSVLPKNDIALIRLMQSVSFTQWIRPICLPFAPHLKNSNFDKVIFTVAGFGRVENGTFRNIKLKRNIPEYNLSACNSTYNQLGVSLTSKHLCAGDEKKDTCKGDTGGPLMAQERLNDSNSYVYMAGIVSSKHRFCGLGVGYPGVFTRVDQYLDWILDHVKP